MNDYRHSTFSAQPNVKLRPLSCFVAVLFSGFHSSVFGDNWPQDCGNAQRSGFTAEEARWPWKFVWTWNGPDARGGDGGHRYQQPRAHEPWEARICAGGGLIFAPAGERGLYALRAADGSVAWQFVGGTCQSTPAFDSSANTLFVGTDEGKVFKLDARSGQSLGSFSASSAVGKSMLLADGHVFALTVDGTLHKLEAATLKPLWNYRGGAKSSTTPAYSSTRNVVIFCTDDLRVHCVSGRDGTSRWCLKPTPFDSSADASFAGGWPVIAEKHGIVFVRLALGNADKTVWSGGESKGKWPDTSAAIRRRLEEHPELKNLFALRLEDGRESFTPAVGPAGVEDLRDGRPWLRVHALPVIRCYGEHEVAYIPWRNGDTRDASWDGRWDSHLGEMVLDDATVPDLTAGDLRFVQFEEHGGWMHITDESCPVSMARDTIFSAHWDASQSARIVDRSPERGRKRADPIPTVKLPPVARHLRLTAEELNPSTHWLESGMNLMDGRYLKGPGWWVYVNTLDPPTPKREAYSEGVLPRYTCVANGLIIVQGNGGELFVLRHD